MAIGHVFFGSRQSWVPWGWGGEKGGEGGRGRGTTTLSINTSEECNNWFVLSGHTGCTGRAAQLRAAVISSCWYCWYKIFDISQPKHAWSAGPVRYRYSSVPMASLWSGQSRQEYSCWCKLRSYRHDYPHHQNGTGGGGGGWIVSETEFLNVYGSSELIPRNEFLQHM